MEQNIFTKKQVILYNTFNIHENETFIYICLKEFLNLCSFNYQKHI
jgi:hypothetical protein